MIDILILIYYKTIIWEQSEGDPEDVDNNLENWGNMDIGIRKKPCTVCKNHQRIQQQLYRFYVDILQDYWEGVYSILFYFTLVNISH